MTVSTEPTSVYKASQKIVQPETDLERAQRQEKIRQIMKESNQDSYVLFNHQQNKHKVDLIYLNSRRLEFWDKIIQIRRENRRLGLFKMSKDLSLWQVLLGILVVCLIGLGLLSLSASIKKIKAYIDESLLESLLSMSSDILILTLMLTLFNAVALYNLALTLQMTVNIEQIAVAGFLLLMLWIAAGCAKIAVIQLKVNEWDALEASLLTQSEAFRQFARLKTKMNAGESLSKEEKQELSVLEDRIKYLNMRDDFINPTFLPAVSEHKYRDDFPFSEYLTISVSRNLKRFLRFDLWSYVVFVGVLMATISSIFEKSHYIMVTLPTFVCLGCSVLVMFFRLHMLYVISQCSGRLKHEDLIEFTQLNQNAGFKISAVPELIRGNQDKSFAFLGSQNLQERMFLLRTPPLTFHLVRLAEVAIVSTIICSSPILFFFAEQLNWPFWMLLAAELVALFVILWVTPAFIIDYSVASKIVMLRDTQMANEAVDKQKNLLYPSYRAVYRALKMLAHVTGKSTDVEFVRNSLHPLHKVQVLALCSQLARKSGESVRRDRLEIMGIKDLAYLLGQNLTEEEWMIVAQECLAEEEEVVTLDKLLSCIEKMADDTKKDPYNIMLEVISDSNYRDELVNQSQNIDLKAFNDFLAKHRLLNDEDREIVVSDLALLTKNPSEGLNREQLVSHMRNMVEVFAR